MNCETSENYQQKIAEMQAHIDQLTQHITCLERGLNVEVWDYQRAKFVPFKEMPEVRRVLSNES